MEDKLLTKYEVMDYLNIMRFKQRTFNQHGGNLEVYYGKPASIWGELLQDESIDGVYSNEDYEPYAMNRDQDGTQRGLYR